MEEKKQKLNSTAPGNSCISALNNLPFQGELSSNKFLELKSMPVSELPGISHFPEPSRPTADAENITNPTNHL